MISPKMKEYLSNSRSKKISKLFRYSPWFGCDHFEFTFSENLVDIFFAFREDAMCGVAFATVDGVRKVVVQEG